MNSPYWKYETSIHPNICISIRNESPFCQEKYDNFLNNFIEKYKDRITSFGSTEEFLNGEICTIIKLKGFDPICFTNKK